VTREILLGPALDLHTGIHRTLVEHPPAGYRFSVRSPRHVFLHRARAGFSPLVRGHAAELVDFGPGRALVHTARWPVLNRPAWVADLDDLGYPVYAGRAALSTRFRRGLRGLAPAALAEQVGERMRTMLAAYLHPSCRGLLFRSRYAVARALTDLEQMGYDPVLEALADKSYVIHPACPAAARATVDAKWRATGPMRIVFCGRDFATKDGALALRVMERIIATSGRAPQVSYVGHIPPEAHARHRALLGSSVDHYPSLSRRAVLRLFAASHVLFHPSPVESFGMVFSEAAAAGMAVVASAGQGLAHLAELLPATGVVAVDRDHGSPRGHEDAFVAALGGLVAADASDRAPERWRRARRMGLANHRAAVVGPLSIRHRDEILHRVYDGAAPREAGLPLTIDALDLCARWQQTWFTGRKLERAIADYRRTAGIRADRIFF
jgi:glycosyltransferase involved in cell wall biosynthesis